MLPLHTEPTELITKVLLYIEMIKYLFARIRPLLMSRLEKQVMEYYEAKKGRYPSAANTDLEYLYLLLKITKARTVSEIGSQDIKKVIELVAHRSKTRYFVNKCRTSLSNFMRYHRARGLPTLRPYEIRNL